MIIFDAVSISQRINNIGITSARWRVFDDWICNVVTIQGSDQLHWIHEALLLVRNVSLQNEKCERNRWSEYWPEIFTATTWCNEKGRPSVFEHQLKVQLSHLRRRTKINIFWDLHTIVWYLQSYKVTIIMKKNISIHTEKAILELESTRIPWQSFNESDLELDPFYEYYPFMLYHWELTHNIGTVILCWNEI
jgi:hypothetical protein